MYIKNFANEAWEPRMAPIIIIFDFFSLLYFKLEVREFDFYLWSVFKKYDEFIPLKI